MDHSTAVVAAPNSGPDGVPAAPSPAALPLPASPPPLAVPANDPPSDVSYESISRSERSVFDRKLHRYQDWTENVFRQGGVEVSESSFGRAGGVGSASWGSLPTIKALSRDGTEPSTIVDQRTRARQALKHPHHTTLRPHHYAPLVIPPAISVEEQSLSRSAPSPLVASRIVDTPAPMTSVDLLSPPALLPAPNYAPALPEKPVSPKPSHSNVRQPPSLASKPVSRKPSRQEMRRPSPTPYLATPQLAPPPVDRLAGGPSPKPLTPVPSRQNLALPPAMGSDRPSSGHSGHSTHSAYREREAYLSSALHLPLDMLSETEVAPVPLTRRNSLKRWTSLLRKKSGQPAVLQPPRRPRVLSGPGALLPEQGGSTLKKKPSDRRKNTANRLSRSHTIGVDVNKEKGTAKEATLSSVSLPAKEKGSLRSQNSTRKPLPPGPEVTITPAESSRTDHAGEIEVLAASPHSNLQHDNALRLDPGRSRETAGQGSLSQTDRVPALGSSSSRRSARPTQPSAPQNTPINQRPPSASRRPAQPAQSLQQAPVIHPPHRQPLPLPRPALSREVSSIDGLTRTLGRRHRDPSLTNLTARFEPEMYSLPDSAPTGDERTESPVKNSRANLSHQHLRLPADPQPSLAERRARSIEPVTLTPELVHPQPHSTVPSRMQGLASPHDIMTPRATSRSPVRVTSPSERREVQFSPRARDREDEEEVRFEVPSRSNGRLRVSVAWLRDRQRNGESEMDSNGSPPPLPPKAPASLVDRFKRRNQETGHSPPPGPKGRQEYEQAYPAPPSVSQAQSPPPLGRNFFHPFWPNGRLPAYSPPPLAPVYQMQQGMAYPQPGMPYGPWLHPAQAYPQPPKSHRPPSPPRPPSIEPPSSQGSPVANPPGLPQMPYPNQPGMPWYPQPGQHVPSQYPGRVYENRDQGRNRNGPSFWQKLFKGRNNDDGDPVNNWRRGVLQAPPAPPTVMSRGPMTAPMYRDPAHPQSQRTAWWRRPPASAWSNDRHTMTQEEYMRREEMQRYNSQRRRDGRRPRRGSGGSVWDVFKRSTDEIYTRSPPRRNGPLPPPASSAHPTPVQSPTRRQVSNRDRQPQYGPRRPGLAQRWSSRKWMNGNARPARTDRPRPPLRVAQNGFLSHSERQKAKEQRREYKRQRREAREQRRQANAKGDRYTNGRFFNTRQRDDERSGANSRSRSGAWTTNQREGRGRDMSMVGDWARGITKLFREADGKRQDRGRRR